MQLLGVVQGGIVEGQEVETVAAAVVAVMFHPDLVVEVQQGYVVTHSIADFVEEQLASPEPAGAKQSMSEVGHEVVGVVSVLWFWKCSPKLVAVMQWMLQLLVAAALLPIVVMAAAVGHGIDLGKKTCVDVVEALQEVLLNVPRCLEMMGVYSALLSTVQ